MGFINLLSLFCLILIYFYTRYLLKKPQSLQFKVIKIQLLLVLLYNIVIHIVVPTKLPIELSTISYFLVPVILYFNIKRLNIWAVYASILSGALYYFSMIVAGQQLYGHFPVYSYLTSLFNHGTLLIYSVIMLKNVKFFKSERYIIWIGLLATIVYALLMRPLVTHPGRVFIFEVLDADLVNAYFSSYGVVAYSIYYILFALFLYSSSNMVHYFSKVLYHEGS